MTHEAIEAETGSREPGPSGPPPEPTEKAVDPESSVVGFLRVTLARTATCDTCAGALERGEKGYLVLTGMGAGAPRFRCAACFAGDVDGVTAPPSSRPGDFQREGSTRTLGALRRTRASLASVLALAAAAGLIAATRSRIVRRAVVTAAVGVGAAFRHLVARVRGKRDRGPAITRRAFEELGPTYVKLGQLVASSQGLFPERYCVEFQACLDRVKPFPFERVLVSLRSELGREPSEIFSDLDSVPLASASIAQVHAARLRSGEDVVVKVQRPDIGDIVEADLRILRVAARAFAWVPRGELANPVGIVEDFEAHIREELDFVREAANMDEFNRIMAACSQNEVAAPRVFHSLTTRRVLVMERFHGHRVDDVERHRARGVDGEAKLLLGMRAWFQCLILYGFFHGDVHAGNLMARDDETIGFLDFGIVGRFSPERRTQVTDYLLAFASGDFRRLAEVMVAMGSVGARVDLEALARDLETAYEPMLSQGLGSVKYADLLPAIMRTAVKHAMRLPRDFVLISKQMLYFDRYAKVLAPELNIFRDPRIVTALAADVMAARLRTGDLMPT